MNKMNAILSGTTLLTSVMLVLLLAGNSTAYVLKTGDEVYVSEKVNDDLVIAGENIKFDGELLGDVISGGMDIVVSGTIDGNVNVAGYSSKVGGTVTRSVRMVGYKNVADGYIGNNLLMVGAIARVSSTCEIQNDAAISSSMAYIYGTILGGLTVTADQVIISGTISDDVHIEASKSLKIERTAVISGDLTYSCPNKAEIADDAQIEGDKKWKRVSSIGKEDPLEAFITTVVLFVGAFITGLILFALCGEPACSVRSVITEKLWNSFAVGLISFVLVPIVLIFSLLTVVGIPVSIVTALSYAVLLYIAKIFVAAAIGDRILKMFSSSEKRSQTLGLLIGLVVITVAFEIPYAGIFIYVATMILGLGAILIAVNNARKSRKVVTVAIKT